MKTLAARSMLIWEQYSGLTNKIVWPPSQKLIITNVVVFNIDTPLMQHQPGYPVVVVIEDRNISGQPSVTNSVELIATQVLEDLTLLCGETAKLRIDVSSSYSDLEAKVRVNTLDEHNVIWLTKDSEGVIVQVRFTYNKYAHRLVGLCDSQVCTTVLGRLSNPSWNDLSNDEVVNLTFSHYTQKQ